MSQTFAGIKVLPYVGQFFSRPVSLSPGELILPGNKSKSTCPISIRWNDYWVLSGNPTALGISFNLDGTNSGGAVLDKIRALKIDNTNSTVPIYIVFPDTLDVITCPPQTAVTLPTVTDSLQGMIYTVGLTTGFVPETRIQLLNYCVPPSIDPAIQLVFPQWLGSPTQQRANLLTPGYGAPALGDQTFFGDVDFNSLSVLPLMGTPRASGILTITGLTLRAHPANLVPFSIVTLSMNGIAYGQIYGISEYFLTDTDQITSVGATLVSETLLERSGMNLRLPADDTIYITATSTNGLNGSISAAGEYCYQP